MVLLNFQNFSASSFVAGSFPSSVKKERGYSSADALAGAGLGGGIVGLFIAPGLSAGGAVDVVNGVYELCELILAMMLIPSDDSSLPELIVSTDDAVEEADSELDAAIVECAIGVV